MKKIRYIFVFVIIVLMLTNQIASESNATAYNNQSEKEQNEIPTPNENITIQEPINSELNKTINYSSEKIISENITENPTIQNNQTENKIIENIETNITSDTLFINLDTLNGNTSKIDKSSDIHHTEENNQNTESTSPEANDSSIEETKKVSKKVKVSIMKNNLPEIEANLPEDLDINKIKKTETQLSDKTKEVVIKSDVHVEYPIIVYSDIQETKDKKNIKINWINENKTVPIKEYVDKNNNGFIDRIAWEVPHLSEQVFEIIIDTNSQNTPDTEIKIKTNSPSNGSTATNPVNFNFDINYTNTSLLDCNLSFNDTNTQPIEITTSSQVSESRSFDDGAYTWLLLCKDDSAGKTASATGNFRVNEGYSLTIPREFYVLNPNNTIYGNPNKIVTVTSANPSAIKEIRITKDTTELNKTNITSDSFDLSPYLTAAGNYKIYAKFYSLEIPYEINKSFSVAKVEINPNITEAEVEELIGINVKINSPAKMIDSIIMDFGDGSSNIDYYGTSTTSFDQTYKHKYNSEGNYTLKINFRATDNGVATVYTIQKNGIKVIDPGDNSPPEIELISPENGATINSSRIDFKFKVNDEGTIKNCTYELYNYSGNVGNLDYSENITSLEKNKEKTVSLVDFQEGDYTWYIGCYDNSSNYKEGSRDFTFSNGPTTIISSSSTYPEKSDLEQTRKDLNDFLESVDLMGFDEKQALEDLGIMENLTYYSKRLIQIDQDLANNIKYISDNITRSQRQQDLLEEYKSIKSKIPKGARIIDSTEFTKNSITQNLEEILAEYTKDKKIATDVKKLADHVYDIQSVITTETKGTQLEIEYSDRKEDITLVKKGLNIKNESIKTILEFLPDDLKDATFITPAKKISQNIYETDYSDLDKKEIVYYTEKLVNLDSLKDSETLLFENAITESSKITGFFLINPDYANSPSTYLILLIALVFLLWLLPKIIVTIKMIKWKKEEDVMRAIRLIGEAKESLKMGDAGQARESYKKIRELYPLLPEGFKKHSSKELKRIMVGIDRREILGLVKEYEKAKQEKRIDDEKKLYEDLKKIYKRLPEKDRTRVYHKIFRSEWD